MACSGALLVVWASHRIGSGGALKSSFHAAEGAAAVLAVKLGGEGLGFGVERGDLGGEAGAGEALLERGDVLGSAASR